MSTKEQIQKAAMKAFGRKEAAIGDTGDVKAALRELSQATRRTLNAKLYKTPAGSDEPETFNKEGVADPNGDQWHYRENVKPVEEWIAATIEPSFTVDEISKWPESLKRDLFEQARRVNGIEAAETIAKNS